jgi:Fic family protein
MGLVWGTEAGGVGEKKRGGDCTLSIDLTAFYSHNNGMESELFTPRFTLTPAVVTYLMQIEGVKQAMPALPLTPHVLARLRETARLFSTHYSTQIEGNRLTEAEVAHVLETGRAVIGRERDEAEVKGYYAALKALERLASSKAAITEKDVQKIHALVMGEGRTRLKPTPYRDGQNVIRDSRSKAIITMPPEAKDVAVLMKQLLAWLAAPSDLPVPVKAGIAHYQYATIHPYYDGNGRTARLLTTLVLHKGGYDLGGIYALEEYYARDLGSYYQALSLGPSHNYYLGRQETDITPWLAYFIQGMAEAFAKVYAQAQKEASRGRSDQTRQLRGLDSKQRQALTLFITQRTVTSADIGRLCGYKARMASVLCSRWVAEGFLVIDAPSRKARRYALHPRYEAMMEI